MARGNLSYDQIRSSDRAGNGDQLQTFNGSAPTAGHLAAFDSSGALVDSGSVPTGIPSGSANEVLATPNGSAGVASLRALVATDIPALPYDAAGAATTAVAAIPTATASVKGLLASADWTAFNNKQAALGFTPASLTVNTFSGIQTFTVAPVFSDQPNTRLALGLGTAATTASTAYDAAGAATTAVAAIPTATASVKGLLASTDWTTFNNKQAALGFTPASLTVNTFSGIQTFTVAPVFTDQPNSRLALGLGTAATTASTAYDAAGAATTAVAAIPTATASVKGLLASADWTTFNSKQAALGFTPASLTVNTFSGIQTFSVAPVFSDQPNSRLALGLGTAATTASTAYDASGTAASAVAGIPTATASVKGLLASADWTTFNNKQSTLSVFVASGSSHAAGIVPDPGATAGTTRFLREDATFAVPQNTVVWGSITGTLSSQTDLNTALAGKQATLTPAALTEDTSSVLTITGGTSALLAATSIQVKQATASVSGYLSSTDWTTFTGKQSAISIANDTNVTASIASGLITLGFAGQLAIARGGTGQTTAASAFNSLSPLTTLGDTLYGGTSGAGTRLAGNTTAAKLFLVQTGTGTASAAPSWAAIAVSDLPVTLNVNVNGVALAAIYGGTASVNGVQLN